MTTFKLLFFGVLSILSFSPGFDQDNVVELTVQDEAKVDSLQTIVTHEAASNTNKIEALINLGETYARYDLDIFLDYSKEAATLSEKYKNDSENKEDKNEYLKLNAIPYNL